MESAMGHIRLSVGEVIQKGDQYLSAGADGNFEWCDVDDLSVGKSIENGDCVYRRPMMYKIRAKRADDDGNFLFLDASSTQRKDTNPKDAVGIRKWRVFSTIPMTVMWELGAALMEGARKYGRHNYRVSGVRASVYVDAAMGHISQWWEGEDTDSDSGLSHITKAIASLVVLRDAMIQKQMVDDRPPCTDLNPLRGELQRVVDGLFERHPDAKEAHVR